MEGRIDPAARDVAIAPCRACPACRAWERALDAWRLRESAGETLALVVIPEARWSATRQRLTRAGAPYHSTPIEGDRRAVLVPVGSPVPGVPVDDVADTLAALEGQRNRADKRRVSTSGLRPRAQVEAIAYGNPGEEETPQARAVVGFFSARAVSSSSDPAEVAQTVQAAATALGIDTTRKGLVIAVDGNRYGPRLDRLWLRLGVHWIPEAIPWNMGGPPPAIDSPAYGVWQTARFGHVSTWNDPPLEAYREASA